MRLDPPNLDVPDGVAMHMAGLIRSIKVGCFVDAGCGDGKVLFAAAHADPACRCVGLEIDRTSAVRASARAFELGLRNVRVVLGDLHRTLAAARPDVVFCYLGGAHHQRVGAMLRRLRRDTLLVTALYPAIGLPAADVVTKLEIPLYFYFPRHAARRGEWAAPVSVSVAFAGGAQLTTLAFTVYHDLSRLSVEVRGGTREARGWVEAFLGDPFPRDGQTVMMDVLVRPPVTSAARPPVVLELVLRHGGLDLSPSHTLVVGGTTCRPVEAKGPWPELDAAQVTRMLRSDPKRLVRLVSRLPDSWPAA